MTIRCAPAGILLLAAATAACSNSTPVEGELPAPGQTVPALLGEEVRLAVGQAATYPEGLSVTYVRLVGDSRCPMDVVCVWAGDATVLLRVADGRKVAVEVTLHTNGEVGSREHRSGAFLVTLLGVEPYPQSTAPRDPALSKVVLRVTRPQG